MTTSSNRVLIAGGGVGGAALAIALSRGGRYEPTVYEARTYDGTQVGGCYVLWYAGVKSLQRLGLADLVASAGNPIRRLEMCDRLGRVLFGRDVGRRGDELGGVPMAVRRVDLVNGLYAELPERGIRFGSPLRDVTQDDREVRVTFTDGREERGAALVGADGLNSTVRAHLHGMEPARHPGYAHWFGVVEDGGAAPDGVFRILHGRGMRFAFFRLDERSVCWWCVRNAPGDRSGDILGSPWALAQLTQDWDPICSRLLEATPPGSITRRDTFYRKPIREWGRGRITLLGDAAHAMTFDLGQGAGTAFSDAVSLGDHLSRGDGLLRSLRAYEADRRDVTLTLAWASRKIGGASAWSSPLGSKVNAAVLRTIGAKVTPALLERDARSHRLTDDPPPARPAAVAGTA